VHRKHGFDVHGCEERVRAELTARGVSVASDATNPFARRYDDRVRERFGPNVVLANPCTHALWAHVAASHQSDQLNVERGCKHCALLLALWLPQRLTLNKLDARCMAYAKGASKALGPLTNLCELLSSDPSSKADLATLENAKSILEDYSKLHEQVRDPELRQGRQRGQRSYDLLRQIENALHAAEFSDRQVACLVHGRSDSSTLTSIRDRRRTRSSNAAKAPGH
jgi:hypothetical protein